MRWINNYLIPYYNSHLFSLFSIWLGSVLFKVQHPFLAMLMATFAVLKLAGIYFEREKFRLIGLMGLNSIWGVSVYYFMSGQHPQVTLTYHFPLFILLFGLGVGLRGRFNAR